MFFFWGGGASTLKDNTQLSLWNLQLLWSPRGEWCEPSDNWEIPVATGFVDELVMISLGVYLMHHEMVPWSQMVIHQTNSFLTSFPCTTTALTIFHNEKAWSRDFDQGAVDSNWLKLATCSLKGWTPWVSKVDWKIGGGIVTLLHWSSKNYIMVCGKPPRLDWWPLTITHSEGTRVDQTWIEWDKGNDTLVSISFLQIMKMFEEDEYNGPFESGHA